MGPIGVGDVPEAADENDCMISPLMHQLFSGASIDAIASWVCEERVEHFGLGRDDQRDLWLAGSVAEWWRARTSEAAP